jgi:hypothetical protein
MRVLATAAKQIAKRDVMMQSHSVDGISDGKAHVRMSRCSNDSTAFQLKQVLIRHLFLLAVLTSGKQKSHLSAVQSPSANKEVAS